jgi:hypothetical protein
MGCAARKITTREFAGQAKKYFGLVVEVKESTF